MTLPSLATPIALAIALCAGAASPAFASHHGGTHGTSAATPSTPTKDSTMSTKDIVDTAVGAGQFETLAAALGAAGLVDTLKGPGPFTVFAPTDAAFAALPAGTVEDLLKP